MYCVCTNVLQLAASCALQIGGAVTPHDGQCHLREVTVGGETYYEYEDALRLVRTLAMDCVCAVLDANGA